MFTRFLTIFLVIICSFVKGVPPKAHPHCHRCKIYLTDSGFMAAYKGTIYDFSHEDQDFKEKLKISLREKSCNSTCTCLSYYTNRENDNYDCGLSERNGIVEIIFFPVGSTALSLTIIRVNCRKGEVNIAQRKSEGANTVVCRSLETEYHSHDKSNS